MALSTWAMAVAPAHADVDEDEDDNFPSSRSDTTVGDREIDLKGDQFEDMTDAKLKLGVYDLWALGISTALGGQYYLWPAGLISGFGGLIVGFFLIASAYGCLIMCMAELSGALPFAGNLFAQR
jgi:amino acid permease